MSTLPSCGEMHRGLPDQAYQQPDAIFELGEEEKKQRAKCSSDLCMLDNTHHFIRCVLQIPIIAQEMVFGWGVWVSASRENFLQYVELSEFNRETEMAPWFGWLSNRLPIYDNTLNLKTTVYPQSGGKRPLVQLEPNDHLLAVHQREGMPLDLVIQIISPKH